MRSRLQYFVFVMLLIVASALAFRAGQKGIGAPKKNKQGTSQKLFRSFPFFDFQRHSQKKITTEFDGERAVEQSEASSGEAASGKATSDETTNSGEKGEKNKLKKRKKRKHLSSLSFKGAHTDNATDISVREHFLLGSTRMISVVEDGKNEKEPEKKEPARREKALPVFTHVFVPVYDGQHLTSKTIGRFYDQFQSSNHHDKLYVINRVIPLNSGSEVETRYEILVFDRQGKNLGAFSSIEISAFPFVGVPTFESVEPRLFPEVSRFFVFSDFENSQTRLLEIFRDESHVQSIFKSAYRSSLDEQSLVGRDPAFDFNIYTLFPGVYVADRLR